MYKLLKANVQFKWTNKCEESFQQIKKILTSDQVLTKYDPKKPLVLETDASPTGLGAILSHEIDGKLKPIAYMSHTLSKAEQNYSHLDKEATAIIWATKKCYQYLYDKFKLIIDNQPLKVIFNPCKNLPSIVALCLLRYALHLKQFDYEIVYRTAKNHQNVNFLSRKPSQTNQPVYEDTSEHLYTAAVQQLGCSSNSTKTITAEELRKETAEDKELSKLLSDLKMESVKTQNYQLMTELSFVVKE